MVDVSGRTLGSRRASWAPPRATPPKVGAGGNADRAIDELAIAINEATAGAGAVYVADVDLIVGSNVIAHGLGRKPSLVSVHPHTAVASFAWGWDPNQTGARLDMLTTIEIVGVPLTARIVIE